LKLIEWERKKLRDKLDRIRSRYKFADEDSIKWFYRASTANNERIQFSTNFEVDIFEELLRAGFDVKYDPKNDITIEDLAMIQCSCLYNTGLDRRINSILVKAEEKLQQRGYFKQAIVKPTDRAYKLIEIRKTGISQEGMKDIELLAASEIMLDLTPFQRQYARLVYVNKVKDLRGQLGKLGRKYTLKIAAICPSIYVNPSILVEILQEYLRRSGKSIPDAILLSTFYIDRNGEIKKGSILVPNPCSPNRHDAEEAFKEFIREPAYVGSAYIAPTWVRINKVGLCNLLSCDNGFLEICGNPVGPSLAFTISEKVRSVGIVGFLGFPENIRYIKYEVGKRKDVIYLP